MKNSVNIFSVFLLLLAGVNIYGQDFFDDANGNGFPLIYKESNKNLLSGRVNTTDNSIKINLYNNIFLGRWGNIEDKKNQIKYYIGGGLFIKGKAENGLSNLIKSGDLQPGFNTGGYLSFEKSHFIINNDTSYNYMKFILSFSYNYSNLNIYDPALNFSSQLYDTNFYGYSVGFSGIFMPPVGKDDIFLGFSVSATKTNNYSGLDKYEVKDMKNVFDSTGTIIRQVTGDKDSYLYAKGKYKEYTKYGVRINIDYIPSFLNYRAGFIIYPSMEFQDHKNPKYNLGMSLNFLKDKEPLLADAGLFLELNDLTNIADSNDKFFKRSMRLGLYAAWNILTNEKVEKGK